MKSPNIKDQSQIIFGYSFIYHYENFMKLLCDIWGTCLPGSLSLIFSYRINDFPLEGELCFCVNTSLLIMGFPASRTITNKSLLYIIQSVILY